MRTYPEYKDSGVEWIGEIPKGWGVNKLKYSSDLIIEKELPSDGDIKISPENVESFTGKVINYHSDYETEGMKFQKGDTLLNKLRVYLSKFVFCESDGFSMGEMIVFRPREYLPKFQYYLLSNPNIISHFNSLSQGVKVPRPPVDEILNSFCPVVPPSEQKQISDYLDRKTQQIDDLIEKTERKIELLKEQRSSLINQCVTNGLDPNVEMKDSGVEWIGEIPKGWELKKLKFLFEVKTGRDPSSVYVDEGGFKVLGTGGEIGRSSEYMYEGPSLILGRKGTIDKPFLVDEPFWISDVVYYTVPKTEMGTYYLGYLSSLIPFKLFKYGSTLPSMGKDEYENMGFPVPPLSEQKQISDYLDRETSKIDQMVDTETKRIELLKEYRQSLISNVVTGKIDVRDEVVQ